VSWPKASEAEKLSEKKKSTPIRLDNGVNLIPMWNRLQQRRKAGVGSASERTNSSGVLKGMFSRTAKFFTCSPGTAVLSQPWGCGMRGIQPLVRLPPLHIDPNCHPRWSVRVGCNLQSLLRLAPLYIVIGCSSGA